MEIPQQVLHNNTFHNFTCTAFKIYWAVGLVAFIRCKTTFSNRGVMIAFFHSARIFPTDIELLNSIAKGNAKCDAKFLKKSEGKPSGPLDLLLFSFRKTLSTFSGVKVTLSHKGTLTTSLPKATKNKCGHVKPRYAVRPQSSQTTLVERTAQM